MWVYANDNKNNSFVPKVLDMPLDCLGELVTSLTWYCVWPAGWRTSGLGPERARRCLDPGLPCEPLERIGPIRWYVVSLILSSGVLAANCRPLKSGSEPVLFVTDGIWMLESCFGESWMLQQVHMVTFHEYQSYVYCCYSSQIFVYSRFQKLSGEKQFPVQFQFLENRI